jgi:hypothetical protein
MINNFNPDNSSRRMGNFMEGSMNSIKMIKEAVINKPIINAAITASILFEALGLMGYIGLSII